MQRWSWEINEGDSRDGAYPSKKIPFSYSIMLMKNMDVTMCMWIDYRVINKKTIKKWYGIPRIDELHGFVYFLKVELKFKYHHIRFQEKYIEKTTFKCHFENYELLVIPFGLKQMLQHLFNLVIIKSSTINSKHMTWCFSMIS